MPKSMGKSELSALASQMRSAFEDRKGTEVSLDAGGRLPAGIQNGIAQLDNCRITKVKEGGANAGKLQFYAVGIVKEPAEYRGLRTQIIEPLYETPKRTRKTPSDHFYGPGGVADTVSRLLGRKEIGDEVSIDNIEATMVALSQAKPHFRFRTWVGAKQVIDKRADGKWIVYEEQDGKRSPSERITGAWATKEAAEKANPNAGRDPMVNEVWGQLFNYSDNGQLESAVEEGPTPAPAEEEESGVEEEEVTGATAETDDEVDLQELAQTASGRGPEAEEAERVFIRIGKELGIDAQTIQSADSWEDVVTMIEGARASQGVEEEEGEEETSEEEFVEAPKKGQVAKHTIQVTVVNKKTKKRTKKDKVVDCTIESVNTKDETVVLKSLEDGKTLYKDVPWDQLGD